jgi:O-acetyl-ADP-ribose deacetylase (regulator of RNase III)
MKTKIEIVKSDITTLAADVIVNAANTTLLGGGGVDGAIHKAAGPNLRNECKVLGGCKTGQAKITKGYNLPASYVIHTVGPVWRGGNFGEEELLASSYINSLKLAQAHSLKTIAFPSISTGAYRFPIKNATSIALKTVKAFLNDHPEVFQKVIFVVFSDKDLEIYQEINKATYII